MYLKRLKEYIMTKKIKKPSNKCKTTWDIIKKLTNNQHSQTDIQELTIDSKHLKDQLDITDAINI